MWGNIETLNKNKIIIIIIIIIIIEENLAFRITIW